MYQSVARLILCGTTKVPLSSAEEVQPPRNIEQVRHELGLDNSCTSLLPVCFER